MVEEILLQRGITIEVMRNEDAVESKLKQLREDRLAVADNYNCFMWMKDYIRDTLDAAVQQDFEYDPKKNVPIVEAHPEKHVVSSHLKGFKSKAIIRGLKCG